MKQALVQLLKSKALKIVGTSWIAASACMVSAPASAAIDSIFAVPTNWRLAYYPVTIARSVPSTAVFYTGVTATCAGPNQGLGMANAVDAKRLYDTVMAAKLAKVRMYIYYDNQNCEIEAFGLAEG